MYYPSAVLLVTTITNAACPAYGMTCGRGGRPRHKRGKREAMGHRQAGRVVFGGLFFTASFLLFFSPAKVALSSSADITIPDDLGYVIETHPASDPARPLIVHIQEAHVNPEARRHIAGILAHLVEQQGLRLILVEGGAGEVGLSPLRDLSSLEGRREVAERYLALGLLSGEEYLDLVSDQPLTLWGIEDEALYQRHVETFLALEPLREALVPVMASLRNIVDARQTQLYPADLKALETKVRAFEEERIGLAEYAEHLVQTAVRHAIPESASPHVARLLRVQQLEEALDPAVVHREQVALVKALSPRVAPEQLEGLTVLATRMKDMKEQLALREQFYAGLARLAAEAGLSLDPYPHLSRYLTYLQAHRRLTIPELMRDLDALTLRLRHTLAETPDCRRLVTVAEQLDLLEKLVALRLSPLEYERVKTSFSPGMFSEWSEFVNREQAARLEAAVPVLRRFYEVAEARDEALAARTVEKLAGTQERLVAVITGGFHSPALTRRLTEQGFGVMVVTPNVSQPTDERLYQAALKYKQGRGTFGEVLRLSRQAAPAQPTR